MVTIAPDGAERGPMAWRPTPRSGARVTRLPAPPPAGRLPGGSSSDLKAPDPRDSISAPTSDRTPDRELNRARIRTQFATGRPSLQEGRRPARIGGGTQNASNTEEPGSG